MLKPEGVGLQRPHSLIRVKTEADEKLSAFFMREEQFRNGVGFFRQIWVSAERVGILKQVEMTNTFIDFVPHLFIDLSIL